MKPEDRIRNIVNESVKDALNESLRCSMSDIGNMYLTMNKWAKFECPVEGFEEFKSALNNAIDKIENVLWQMKFGRPSPTATLNRR